MCTDDRGGVHEGGGGGGAGLAGKCRAQMQGSPAMRVPPHPTPPFAAPLRHPPPPPPHPPPTRACTHPHAPALRRALPLRHHLQQEGQPLLIYEVGGGNGTLARDVLDWLRANRPADYALVGMRGGGGTASGAWAFVSGAGGLEGGAGHPTRGRHAATVLPPLPPSRFPTLRPVLPPLRPSSPADPSDLLPPFLPPPQTTYHCVEISSVLAGRQYDRVRRDGGHANFRLMRGSGLDRATWGAQQWGHAFVLMMEVLDNLPHDRWGCCLHLRWCCAAGCAVLYRMWVGL